MMRRLILAAMLAISCVSLTGCWFFDAKHNRKHYQVMKHDLHLIHQDLDYILLLNHKSPNEAYYR